LCRWFEEGCPSQPWERSKKRGRFLGGDREQPGRPWWAIQGRRQGWEPKHRTSHAAGARSSPAPLGWEGQPQPSPREIKNKKARPPSDGRCLGKAWWAGISTSWRTPRSAVRRQLVAASAQAAQHAAVGRAGGTPITPVESGLRTATSGHAPRGPGRPAPWHLGRRLRSSQRGTVAARFASRGPALAGATHAPGPPRGSQRSMHVANRRGDALPEPVLKVAPRRARCCFVRGAVADEAAPIVGIPTLGLDPGGGGHARPARGQAGRGKRPPPRSH